MLDSGFGTLKRFWFVLKRRMRIYHEEHEDSKGGGGELLTRRSRWRGETRRINMELRKKKGNMSQIPIAILIQDYTPET